ncbi:Zn-dependent protease [Paenibacillus albicereus]|uniref:Zn-dependent protease n=1 Tax=Paenibacillus albicereus TaxID=2726185 RepID=A0A6H2H0L1_9BACL|nr:M50 family metallopeptidase [Paenibacillus albicereus]QJC52888.1 Zn-dependent protease [Paenibacillus albicereus]
MIEVGGIRWSLHPLLAVLMLLSVLTGYIGELLLLFLLVFVHELGHAAAAHAFGWKVLEIRLLPFGGVAELEERPGAPAWEEAAIALAGPLQNVWMAGAAWALGAGGWMDAALASYLVQANLLLLTFNLLPIYPLDGGRLLRFACGLRMNYYGTLRFSAWAGIGCSLLMIGYALLPQLQRSGSGGVQANLLAVGLFLLAANWTYRKQIPFLFLRFLMARGRSAKRRIQAGSRARPIVVMGRHPVWTTARLFLRDHYHLVYVMEDPGRIVGVLPEQRVVEGYLSGDRAVSDLLR